jgi:hypothetical protein
VADTFEYVNELSGPINAGNFLISCKTCIGGHLFSFSHYFKLRLRV